MAVKTRKQAATVTPASPSAMVMDGKGASNSNTSNSNTTTTTKTKKKSFIRDIFSLSTLSSLMAAYYVFFSLSNVLNLMYPLRDIPSDVLNNVPKDRMVFPYWNRDESSASGTKTELGLRVYLSSRPDFSLDYLNQNDEFDKEIDEETDGEVTKVDNSGKAIKDGDSFLLWSEDSVLEATRDFHSRSFVLMASVDPTSSTFCDSNKRCSADQQQAQTSFEFANQWLADSIRHEKQLQSDGGGLISAMNSAGGGIESTSVLLTLYTSVQRNVHQLFESFTQIITGNGGNSTEKADKEELGEEEPKSVIHISPMNPMWRSLMSNGTAYVHVLLVRQTASSSLPSNQHLLSSSPNARVAGRRLQQLESQHNVLLGRVGMMKQELPLHVPPPKRLLYRDLLFAMKKHGSCPVCSLLGVREGKLCDNCTTMVPPWEVTYHQQQAHEEYELARQHKKEGVKYPYWKPEVRIHLIQEEEGYPVDQANRIGFDIVQVRKGTPASQHHPSGYSYLPAVHVDEIGLTSDKYIPLNDTVSALPLRIGFQSEGLTPARYRLLNHLSNSLESQREMGFEQSDIDDLRRLIAETNPTLLAITMLASVLHLLFEFLTFKSDVEFWKSNTDLTGLSVRALFLDWMSQVVILLYLIEMDSSLLMTIPTGE